MSSDDYLIMVYWLNVGPLVLDVFLREAVLRLVWVVVMSCWLAVVAERVVGGNRIVLVVRRVVMVSVVIESLRCTGFESGLLLLFLSCLLLYSSLSVCECVCVCVFEISTCVMMKMRVMAVMMIVKIR